MDRQKVAKEAIAHYNKMHDNPSSEAKNFYIGGWLDGIQELYSLVKRMREAQKDEAAFESELDRKYRGNTWFMSTEEMTERQELCNKVFDLTTEVVVSTISSHTPPTSKNRSIDILLCTIINEVLM